MNEKKYNCGILVGRFLPMHIGHESLVNMSLKKCNKLVIVVTSDGKGIYSVDYVVHLIKKIFKYEIEKGNIIVKSFLENKKIDINYGAYIIRYVENIVGCKVDYIIYGSDKDINKCFSKDILKKIYCDKIDRDKIPISATYIRRYLKENNIKLLKKYLNPAIYDEIEVLKNIINN